MPTTASPTKTSLLEALLIHIDVFPIGAVYRALLGYITFPVGEYLGGEARTDRMATLFLLGALVMLRLVPAVLRKLVSFPAAAQSVWSMRRQLAKRYDSFQWRKLFCIGIGLGAYTAISGNVVGFRIGLSLFCLVSGALGLAIWRALQAKLA
jgi:hypothetical protein